MTPSPDHLSLARERFPVLRQLPEAALARLATEAQVWHLPAGARLFDVDSPCSAFPLVLEGVVRVVRRDPGGREILLYRIEPGEGCVLSNGCLLGNARYPASGEAETPLTLLTLSKPLFEYLVAECPPFREFVFGTFSQRVVHLMSLVEEVAFRRLDQRLAALLVERGPVLRSSHQRLAEELGSVREIISRLLNQFEDRGWVTLGRERIEVRDVAALSDFVEGQAAGGKRA